MCYNYGFVVIKLQLVNCGFRGCRHPLEIKNVRKTNQPLLFYQPLNAHNSLANAPLSNRMGGNRVKGLDGVSLF